MKQPAVAKQRPCVKSRAWQSRSFCWGASRSKGWKRPLALTPHIFINQFKTFQDVKSNDSYILSLSPPPRRPSQPKGRERVRRKEGKKVGLWEKTLRNPKALWKPRALQRELHVTLFNSLVQKIPAHFFLISIPIKDSNIFSLRLLLELSQTVSFRIYYLPRCFTSWPRIWFVTWPIKLFPQ